MRNRPRSALTLSCVLVVFGLSVSTSHANVLANPGFEADAVASAPPTGPVTGWTGASALTASSPDPTRSGIGSLLLDAPGGFAVPVAFQTFAAIPGQVWDLQGYMLTPSALPTNNTSGLLKIVFSDGTNDLVMGASDVLIGGLAGLPFPGAESLPRLNSGSPTNTWVFTQARGVAPAGTVQVSLFAINVDESAAQMYFDDLQCLVIEPIVTTLFDEDNGTLNPATGTGTSLREAVNYAASGSVVTFANTLSGETILLASGQLEVNQDLTIDGSALAGGIAIDGNNSSRIFEFASGTTNVLDSLTLQNGRTPDVVPSAPPTIQPPAENGGAILNNGTLTVRRCTFLNNRTGDGADTVNEVSTSSSAGSGGGIRSEGTLTVENSTFTGNLTGDGGDGGTISAAIILAGSGGDGGAISHTGSGALTVRSSTLISNTCGSKGSGTGSPSYGVDGVGGGIHAPTLDLLENTIVAENSATIGPDLAGTNSAVAGVNLIGDTNGVAGLGVFGVDYLTGDPMLAPLANYGGPTQTLPPLPGSPGIDAGASTTNTPAIDQRGLARIVNGTLDIGAVEGGQGIPTVDYTVVTTTIDFLSEFDSQGVSLRSAVAFCPTESTITFTNTLSGQTIVLTNGQLEVNQSLTIDASTLTDRITIDGNGLVTSNRVMEIATNTTVTLNSLRITGGSVTNSGGGILIDGGSLTVSNSTVSGNQSGGGGGGIRNSAGTLTLVESTISSNSTGGGGGGVQSTSGDLTILRSTVSSNTASSHGGGIFFTASAAETSNSVMVVTNSSVCNNESTSGNGGGIRINRGVMHVAHSTISGNLADSFSGGLHINNPFASSATHTLIAGNDPGLPNLLVSGPFAGTNNITSGDPMLGPLGDYGGPTQTMLPLPGSPAIDAGTSATNTPATDQRGLPRPSGSAVDIGAVEAQLSLVVLNDDDAGPGSLRESIGAVDPGATITFDPSLSGQTITLTSGQLLVGKDLTIDASALADGIILDGNNSSRIFEFASGITNILDSLTLQNGHSADGIQVPLPGLSIPAEDGGAILNQGNLTVKRCTFLNNSSGDGADAVAGNSIGSPPPDPIAISSSGAGHGGAIFNDGDLTIENSTLAANTTGDGGDGAGLLDQAALLSPSDAGDGGAVAHTGSGTLTVRGTTLTENSCGAGGTVSSFTGAHGLGGGIFAANLDLLENTIIADNSSTNAPDLSGTVSAVAGVNFIGDTNGISGLGTAGVDYLTGSPLLAPLANYGGPTHTLLPLPGSPVIDAGASTTNTPATDQRGFTRVVNGTLDIGAVESSNPIPGFLPIVDTDLDLDGGPMSTPVSLRQAIKWAPLGTTITFDPSLSDETILLTSGQLEVNQDLTIDGSALAGGIAIDGNNSSRILWVSSNSTVVLDSLTLQNGRTLDVVPSAPPAIQPHAENGGAILKPGPHPGRTSTPPDTRPGDGADTGNDVSTSSSGGNGGAIHNDGTLTVENSTFTGNLTGDGGNGGGFFMAIVLAGSGGNGGAISHTDNGPLTVLNSTISSNTCGVKGTGDSSSTYGLNGAGGGVLATNLNLLENTIVADNIAAAEPDFSGTASAVAGVNLIGDTNGAAGLGVFGVDYLTGSPLLGLLADNGGPTQTLRPLVGSPVIDAGASTTNTPGTDQRGLSRVVNGTLDIGAVEIQDVLVTVSNGTNYQSEISTQGALLDAVNLGIATSVVMNGVNFTGIGTGNPSGTDWTTGTSAPFTADIGSSIDALFFTEVWNPTPNDVVLTYTNLNPNHRHVVQILHGEPRGFFMGVFTSNDVALSLSGIDTSFGVPDFTIGNNVADEDPPASNDVAIVTATFKGATSFTYNMRAATSRGASISGFQIRDLNLVTTNADAGPGSLRNAVADSFSGDTITFDPSLSGATILLTNGQILIDKTMDVDGGASTSDITIDGNQASRIFSIGAGATVSLNDLTLTGGNGVGSPGSGYGGAILNVGTLWLTGCTLATNSASTGGGAISGPVALLNCTLTGNSSQRGGAINHNLTASLTHCTITGNSATVDGGGVLTFTGDLTVTNSIVAENTPHDISNSSGTVTLAGSNIIQLVVGGSTGSVAITDAPSLAPLGSYGGPTETMPPFPGSPAIDMGGATTLTTDQRGLARVGAPDIGAAEFQGASDVVLFWDTDWDGDGVVFGMELALGTDPLVADADAAEHPAPYPPETGNGMTFGYSPAAKNYSAWIVNRSLDLVLDPFVEIYRFDGPTGIETGTNVIINMTTNTIELIDDSVPLPDEAFYQLEIEPKL